MAKKYFIDVREQHEFNDGHVEGALNFPLSRLTSVPHLLLQEVPLDDELEVIVYCKSGSRSSLAISIMKNLGYQKLTNGINRQNIENLYF